MATDGDDGHEYNTNKKATIQRGKRGDDVGEEDGAEVRVQRRSVTAAVGERRCWRRRSWLRGRARDRGGTGDDGGLAGAELVRLARVSGEVTERCGRTRASDGRRPGGVAGGGLAARTAGLERRQIGRAHV